MAIDLSRFNEDVATKVNYGAVGTDSDSRSLKKDHIVIYWVWSSKLMCKSKP